MMGTEIENDAKAFEDRVREALENKGEEITYREDIDIDEALAQLGAPKKRRKKPDPAAMTASLEERLQSKSKQRRTNARRRAACDLPEGWKRVWYDGKHAILKPTPARGRRYPSSPIWASLGDSPQTRAFNFGRLLMGTCWRSRDEGREKPPHPTGSHEHMQGAPEPWQDT